MLGRLRQPISIWREAKEGCSSGWKVVSFMASGVKMFFCMNASKLMPLTISIFGNGQFRVWYGYRRTAYGSSGPVHAAAVYPSRAWLEDERMCVTALSSLGCTKVNGYT